MKRICIVTIISYNLGNRLQNYALQEVLKEMGCHVETAVRDNTVTIKTKLKNSLHAFRKKTSFDNYCALNRKITWSKKCINTIKDDEYDYFVAGSDQVWNVTFPFVSDKDFLSFVQGNKRIAYAASFGITEIPEEKRKMVIDNLREFAFISVREMRGQELTFQLTGKKATVVLDPTMLINENFWKKVERKPKKHRKGKYIFAYFLGENKEKKLLNDLSTVLDAGIIQECIWEKQHSYDDVGPFEFLYLIHHAEVIITDSFHSSVFSILFERPFLVCERETDEKSMASRLDCLLETFSMEGRKLKENFSVEEIMNVDFKEAKKILERERIASRKFLNDALNL